MVNLRKILKAGYDSYSLGQGREDNFQNFKSQPFARAFENVNYSETKWYALYNALKETLIHKSLELNIPWSDHAYKLGNGQGRLQGHLNSLDREPDRVMAREDRHILYEQPHSRTILDPIMFDLFLNSHRHLILIYSGICCVGYTLCSIKSNTFLS